MAGQEDDFSLHYVLHITVRNILALVTEQFDQTYVLLDRSQTELSQILLMKLQVSGLVGSKPFRKVMVN